MKKILYLLTVVSLLFACNSSDNNNNTPNDTQNTNTENWKVYTVNYSDTGSLPPIKFSFKYPDREGVYVFEADDYNYARIVANKDDDTTFLYSISFGYCKNCHYDEETAFYLLNELFAQFKISISTLENKDTYKENLLGRECFISKNTFKLEQAKAGFQQGDYLFDMIIFPPDDRQPNGLLLLITAEKNNSEYKNFDDLLSKGEIAEILKSIKIKD